MGQSKAYSTWDVIVCGDSHTATHGAFGALAFGIGTSEVEHVLATQTLIQKKSKNLRINVNGALPKGATAKDVILKIIGTIGTVAELVMNRICWRRNKKFKHGRKNDCL